MTQPVKARPDERELVRRAMEGSLDALGELYLAHAERVFWAAYRVTGSRAEAEDVLHDVFVGLRDALRRFDPERPLAPWLGQVAVRTARMRMRSSRRREVRHARAGSERAAAADASAADRVALERALAAMPDRLRTVLLLKEVEGYSHAEIGALLGISAQASATRLARALKLLRHILGRGE